MSNLSRIPPFWVQFHLVTQGLHDADFLLVHNMLVDCKSGNHDSMSAKVLVLDNPPWPDDAKKGDHPISNPSPSSTCHCS